MGRLLSLISAAVFLTPLTAQALTGPDLSVTKTCAVNGPQSVLCTITITNIGTVPSVSPISLTDMITGSAPVNLTGGGGSLPASCSPGAQLINNVPITCPTINTSLTPTNSGTVLFSFKMPQGGTFQNCVTVSQGSNAMTPRDPNLANNTNICTTIIVPPPATGTITITKRIVNNTANPTPGPFQVLVDCGPVPKQTVTLSSQNSFQQSVNIPAGSSSSCTITEQPPAAPLGCEWITTYPSGQTGAAGSTVVVQNELKCEPTGPITVVTPRPTDACVNSVVVSGLHYPGPGQNCAQTTPNFVAGIMGSFHFKSKCSTPNQLLGVTNASCQNTPISGFPGAGGSVYQATVCCGIVSNPQSGHLRVNKTVINTLGVASPSTFSITAGCTSASGALNFPLTLTEGPWVNIPDLIPAGNTCHATEAPQTSIPNVKACNGGSASWVTTYSPASVTIAAGATAGLEVINKLTCDKPTGGTLQIHKSVVNTLSVPTPASFNMTATCSGMAPVAVVVPVNSTVTVPPNGQIPDGTVCNITETMPPQVTGVRACPSGKANWVSSNPGPLTIHAAQTTGTIITNTLECDKPLALECPNPTQTTIGCRGTVTIKRTKGPAIYSVLVSPPATAPTPNIAPSTSSSCVIAGGAMINQTTCWFNYNTNSTAVTLTATSSTGTLPAGFSWSGACSGSSATCLLNVTPAPLNIIANFP